MAETATFPFGFGLSYTTFVYQSVAWQEVVSRGARGAGVLVALVLVVLVALVVLVVLVVVVMALWRWHTTRAER